MNEKLAGPQAAIEDFEQYTKSLSVEELQQFSTALNYEIGFSGVGPTALDRKPDELLSDELKERFALIIEDEKEFRKRNFRAAQILTMGEIDGHYATDEEVAWAEDFVNSLGERHDSGMVDEG